MFTGIIEATGSIRTLFCKKNAYRLQILPKPEFNSLKEGNSLSINGVCLTLIGAKGGILSFDIMEETFKNTSFAYLRPGNTVNIERSLAWKSRIEGHFVLGHVDSVKKLVSIKKYPQPYIDIAIAPDNKIYVVKKGSIAIDGISLTIAEVHKDRIRSYIIPYTLENTNLKYKKVGDPVNIEFDILGKYIRNKSSGFI